jgi:rod shape determining protein RodA
MAEMFFSKLKRTDWVLTTCMASLIAMGTLFIWSACSARQIAAVQNIWHAHACTAVFGFAAYFALASIDYRKLLDFAAAPTYAGALVLLAAVLQLGAKVYGGRRWLWFFQPSEVAKIAVIMFIAHLVGRGDRRSFKWFLAAGTAFAVPALLILKEPDLGTALVLAPSVAVMLFTARVWLKGLVALTLTALLAAGLVLGTVYVAERQSDEAKKTELYGRLPLKPHQIKRLKVFLFPDQDLQGGGYNQRQALISIGSGSVWGKGLRKGELKTLGFLPPSVSMNDFIFAVVAEESGFMGNLLLLTLYLGVLLPTLRIAFMATDERGRLVAAGVATLIFCHIYINIAMSIGLMPITGLPLPFISAGRTFLIVLMASLGLVQSVAAHSEAGGES